MFAKTPTPVLALLAAGVVLAAAASAMLVRSIVDYLENPLAISSTSGNVVFASPDGYVSYKPFEVGFEATLACIAVALMVGAVFIAAATYRSDNRADTAGRNASAHTR
ncbi:hypothetical protein BH10ACT7_BH10ACT7_11890 [soil metagenome]